MTGSKRELRPGVWELRVSLGRDLATGKYKQLSRTYHGDAAGADAALGALVTTELPKLRQGPNGHEDNGQHAAGDDAEATSPTRSNGLQAAAAVPVVEGDGLRALLSALPLDAGECVVGWSVDRADQAAVESEAEYGDDGAAVYRLVHVHRLRRSAVPGGPAGIAPWPVWVRRELVERAQPAIGQDCAMHVWTV